MSAAGSLFETEHYRDCASRAYYAAYQGLTAICVAHGDAMNFAQNRNNPSHEQMPSLIKHNGDLSKQARRVILRHLKFLRDGREHADYKPGQTIDHQRALESLKRLSLLLKEVGIGNE